jgi:hypothetical protein
MRNNQIRGALLAALAALVASPSAAQEPILGASRDDWPTEITRRPLTLARGMAELWAPVTMNLTDEQELEPVNLNPSLYYGLTDSWMVGVRHFVGLCVTGEDEGCPHVYDDVSLDTLFAFGLGTGLQLGVGGALNWAPIEGVQDDSVWSAEARAVVRAGGGAFAVTASPTINFGLSDRGGVRTKLTGTPLNLGTYNVLTPAASFGNREYLLVPVTAQLQLGKMLAVAASASLNGPIDAEDVDFGDVYTIPVSFAAVLSPVRRLDVGAALVFPNLGGADFEGDGVEFALENGWDVRQLSVFAAFRL